MGLEIHTTHIETKDEQAIEATVETAHFLPTGLVLSHHQDFKMVDRLAVTVVVPKVNQKSCPSRRV
jgi:hypothetical protein